MKEPKKYIKIRIRNLDRKKGEKDRSIYTNEADGRLLAIQDGKEIEISEYAYNNLKDAVELDYKMKKVEINEPAVIEINPYPRFDIIELGDFYTKEPKKEEIKEEPSKELIQKLEAKKEELTKSEIKRRGRKPVLNPALQGI